MHFDLTDTIAAIASASGGAARGIVRISGAQAVTSVLGLLDNETTTALLSLSCAGRVIAELDLGVPLGCVPAQLYIWPDARSYTRQPSVEIHTIGTPPILNAVLQAVCRHGARLAGPGEFTLRAFLAGRMDLTQAEAVLGVIDASSRQELDIALAQLAGGLQTPLHELRNQLLDLLAHLEAGLDFVEEDIEFITVEELTSALASIATRLEAIAQQMHAREATANEYRVVLFGAPNAGKSSLLNALAGEAAAIVSDVAGTTRDYVTRRVRIEGLACELIDTAGIGETGETRLVSGELAPGGLGQEKAQTLAQQAQLQLLCIDGSQSRTSWEQAQLLAADQRCLVVVTKSDLPATIPVVTPNQIQVSSVTGLGLPALRQRIADMLSAQLTTESAVVSGTALRCRDSIRQAAEAVERAQAIARHAQGEELVAAELRLALDELGRVVGAVYTDDVLDRIFSRFCIGK